MKILFTIADANLNGGTEILAYNLLQELNKYGIECKLLSIQKYTGKNPDVISLPQKSAEKYFSIANNPLDKLIGRGFSDKFLHKEICKIASKSGYGWIINHTYDLCAAIPVNKSFKTAQVFNWSIRGYEKSIEQVINKKGYANRLLSKIGFNLMKRRWHNAFPRINKLIVLTNAAKEELKNISSKIQDGQMFTIPDPIMYTKDAEKISTLNNKKVIFVGRLSFEKGVIRLLRIWKHISHINPKYSLVIYGEGEAKNEMVEYISTHNLSRVLFKGFCNNLEQIYTNSDLLLMTSDSEGFGMVLIEAMYYGVPCISFDCPISPKEIIADAGVIVPCYNEKLYAEKVLELLNNNEYMRILQKRAIKQAQKYFINNIIEQWKVLLK
ncbi:glycosyltransferase [Bacteroides sp.]|uniref:glycosyltransferase n=1 Tax=Bacteroides sp. TaxID=29523 RepID=UPI003A8FBDC6